MRRAVQHWFLVVSLVLAVGFHWPVLQGIGWTSMFLSRLRTQSVGEALSGTFSGRNPCRICRMVAASQESSTSSQAVSIELRQLDVRPWQMVSFDFSPPRVKSPTRQLASDPPWRSHAPPVPPPRWTV